MRRIAPAFLVLVAAACHGDPGPAPTSPPIATATGTVTAGSPSGVAPTPSLPAGVPTAFPSDAAAGDVPVRALVPKGATVDGTWYATLPTGDAIVVAYEQRSADPFYAPRGLLVWRRFDTPPYWRPTFGLDVPSEAGVLSVDAVVADVTGDGSPDALVQELTGGSGACGTWRVIDLAEGTQVWEKGDLCDAQVVPSTDPVGLTLTEAVFKPGDSHCCPSSTRTTLLSYAGGGEWIVAARKVTRNG